MKRLRIIVLASVAVFATSLAGNAGVARAANCNATTLAGLQACVNARLNNQWGAILNLRQRVAALEDSPTAALLSQRITALEQADHWQNFRLRSQDRWIDQLQATDLKQNSRLDGVEKANATQDGNINTLMGVYTCEYGKLLNVTTTFVTNKDGYDVEALILNHHSLVPNWGLVYNGCHSTP